MASLQQACGKLAAGLRQAWQGIGKLAKVSASLPRFSQACQCLGKLAASLPRFSQACQSYWQACQGFCKLAFEDWQSCGNLAKVFASLQWSYGTKGFGKQACQGFCKLAKILASLQVAACHKIYCFGLIIVSKLYNVHMIKTTMNPTIGCAITRCTHAQPWLCVHHNMPINASNYIHVLMFDSLRQNNFTLVKIKFFSLNHLMIVFYLHEEHSPQH